MKVHIHMQSQANPVVRTDVVNAYTKDGMYCVYREGGFVEKYPLCNMWNAVEDYAYTKIKEDGNCDNFREKGRE